MLHKTEDIFGERGNYRTDDTAQQVVTLIFLNADDADLMDWRRFFSHSA